MWFMHSKMHITVLTVKTCQHNLFDMTICIFFCILSTFERKKMGVCAL